MALYIHPDVQDQSLNYIKNNANKEVICSTAPTTYTEANSTYKLAEQALIADDMTVADDTDGRKITVAAKEGIDVTTSGKGNWVALLDTATSKLLYVTDGDGESLSDTGTVSIPAWKVTIENPTAVV